MAFLDAKVKSIILNAIKDEEIKREFDSFIKERIREVLRDLLDGMAKNKTVP